MLQNLPACFCLLCICLPVLFALFISIGSFVYLFKIRSDTKLDTFQQPFQPGQKEKLFTFFSNTTSADIGMKCELYEGAILNPKVNKLRDVFYLNIESIHSKTTYLLILYILTIPVLSLTFLGLGCLELSSSLGALCFAWLAILANFAILILNFVLYALMIISFYKGDTHRFIEFLSCANVNREEFGNYLFVEKLNKDFKIFMIFNLISLFMAYNSNRNKKANESKEKESEKEKEKEKTEIIGIVENK